jgi:tetratricopeptide (TPR) repeat protein
VTSVLQAPYPGLRSFRRSEAELFFGRDGCVNVMVDRLAATRFLAVLGSSGTGKSSLVNAGLLDGLELGLMAQAGSCWRIVDFRLQDAPLRNLARRLLETGESQIAESGTDVELLRKFLARGPRSIIEWCRAGHLSKGENLLLLVDQFEELFRDQDYAGREEAEAFVDLLMESAHTNEFPVYVTITMRSEYLGACALIDGLAEEINAGMYLTPRMTREQCREAIVEPARLYDIEIEDALVNRLLNDLTSFAPWDASEVHQNTQLDRLVRRADQLPLLQYTLNRMWFLARERTGEGHVKLGLADYKGLSFALNEHADEIFERLKKEKLPVEEVFRALTSGTSIADAVRQPTRFDRLVSICGGDESAVRKVVNAYAAPECNFLLPESNPLKPFTDDTVIDISHESLIRQWKRLSEWMAKESNAALQWRRLNDRYTVGEPLRGRELANLVAWREETKPNPAWVKRYGGDYPALIAYLDKSERGEKRRRWMRTGTVAAVFAIVLLTSMVIFHQKQTAESNLARAESNYAIAKDRLSSLAIAGVPSSDEDPHGMLIIEVNDSLQKVKETLNKLEADNPNDPELGRMRPLVLKKFIDAYRASGYSEAALDIAIETGDLFHRLAAREPDNPSWRQYLSLNLSTTGDLWLDLGNAASARSSYEEALALDRALVLSQLENEGHSRRVSAALVKIGDLQLRANDEAGARKSYDEALGIRRKLANDYPSFPIYQRDLSSTLGRLAELDVNSNHVLRALELYQEKLNLERQLEKMEFNWLRERDVLAIASDLGRMGDLQLQIGHEQDARESYEESLGFIHRLSEGNPINSELKRHLSKTSIAIGNLQLRAGDVAGARRSYRDAFVADESAASLVLNEYLNRQATKKEYVDALGAVSWSALLSNQPQVAAQYAEKALAFDSSEVAIDIKRAHAYLLLGRYDEAKAIYLARKDAPKRSDPTKTYADDIRDGFDTLRRLGIATADGDRMAKEIGV